MIERRMSMTELERVYDLIAGGIDQAGPDKASLFLAKLALALANQVGDGNIVEAAVSAAGRDL